MTREVAFDYLADPVNRPEWQSSLRRVEAVDAGPSGVGLGWIDVTWPGLRPRMQVTAHDRPSHWAESGRWRRAVRADLALFFEPDDHGCVVRAELSIEVEGRGTGAAGRVLTRLARPAVRADLVRASRLLAARQ